MLNPVQEGITWFSVSTIQDSIQSKSFLLAAVAFISCWSKSTMDAWRGCGPFLSPETYKGSSCASSPQEHLSVCMSECMYICPFVLYAHPQFLAYHPHIWCEASLGSPTSQCHIVNDVQELPPPIDCHVNGGWQLVSFFYHKWHVFRSFLWFLSYLDLFPQPHRWSYCITPENFSPERVP